MNILINIGIFFFYFLVWLVTSYFYHKHKRMLNNAGSAREYLDFESKWFRYSTISLTILAFVGVLVIPHDLWNLVLYFGSTTLCFIIIASFSESMNRSMARRAEYED